MGVTSLAYGGFIPLKWAYILVFGIVTCFRVLGMVHHLRRCFEHTRDVTYAICKHAWGLKNGGVALWGPKPPKIVSNYFSLLLTGF
jgi:hypothetical protein